MHGSYAARDGMMRACSAVEVRAGSAWQRRIGRIGRKLHVDFFLRHVDSGEVRTHLPAVARAGLRDKHVGDPERRVIEACPTEVASDK